MRATTDSAQYHYKDMSLVKHSLGDGPLVQYLIFFSSDLVINAVMFF